MLGRRLGRRFLVSHGPRIGVTPPRLARVDGFFDRHGAKAILVGRFVGIVRAVAPFLAGASGMRLRAFLPWSLLGTAAWAATFTLVGYIFHASFSAAADYVAHGAFGLAVVAARRARMAGAPFATIPGVTTPAELARDPDERGEEIVSVLADAFGDLIEADERAFRHKFRKMAASPFAFYRGSAPLFYADLVRLEDPWADERTSRIWIQGDLHAENFGTYMDSAGILVFDVNDFDEAYLGHFTWDLRRMAASLALLGFAKALSDEAIERMIETYGRAYVEQVRAFATGERDSEYRLTLDNTDGVLNGVLLRARLETRVSLLDAATTVEGAERHFSSGAGVRRLEDDERAEVEQAYEAYLETIPEIKRQHSVSYAVKDVIGRAGFGIGSAGLPAYSLLVEGRTQALENDVVLSMKQGNVAAPSRVVDDQAIREYFEHPGHRTAVSQRALQAHADPWLGWCELRGTGQVVKEVSPYEADIDWDQVSDLDEIVELLDYLGQATAKVHCVSDAGSEQTLVEFQTEEAILAVAGDREDEFAADLVRFGRAYGDLARDDHRRFVDAFRNGRIPGVPAD